MHVERLPTLHRGVAGGLVEAARGDQLAELIRVRRDEIIADWFSSVRALSPASSSDERALAGRIPELLDRIVTMTLEIGQGLTPSLPRDTVVRHTLERLGAGFEVTDVVGELHVLRQSILSVCAPAMGDVRRSQELGAADLAIDLTVATTVDEYTAVRARTLVALDRITAAAFESDTVDSLLWRLLRRMTELTPAIDASAILLRDGDLLRVRAAVGAGWDHSVGMVAPPGRGLAGQIAASRGVMSASPPVPEQLEPLSFGRVGVRVVHGVPLAVGEQVIGVALMASTTASEFSLQDQHIFTAMATRASAAIYQRVLRDQAECAVARLEERERQMQALADNIPQLAWMADADGGLCWFNRRWFEYTGTTLEAARGAGWIAVHHPDDVPRICDGFRRAQSSGDSWEDTVRLPGRDGVNRWFLVRAVPIRDGDGKVERWFGTHTDVTAARFLDNATALLASSLGYDDTLAQLARLAVPDLADWCVVDLVNGNELDRVAIAHADPAKLELAREFARSYPPPREGARGVQRVIATAQPAIAAEVTDAMLAESARDEQEARMLRELGVRSWVSAPLVARGKTFGAVSLISRAPRRYQAADVALAAELAHRAAIAVDNARLYREAREALRLRDGVLATVSHDLRSPLNVIELHAMMLMRRVGGADGHDQLDVIARSVQRMARLIDDLLDMASLDAQRLRLSLSRERVRPLIDDLCAMFAPLASERGIVLLAKPGDDEVVVTCDRDRILRVLENLVGNALKFCIAGDEVVVLARHDADQLKIVVRDTGPGIRADDLPRIFEPYWSGRQGKRQRGAGLGLHICKGIVEAHGGSLGVESAEGQGTTFTIVLPLAGPKGGQAPRRAS